MPRPRWSWWYTGAALAVAGTFAWWPEWAGRQPSAPGWAAFAHALGFAVYLAGSLWWYRRRLAMWKQYQVWLRSESRRMRDVREGREYDGPAGCGLCRWHLRGPGVSVCALTARSQFTTDAPCAEYALRGADQATVSLGLAGGDNQGEDDAGV